ncbi:hypothetical protein MKW94_016808 [Papaver nudicaule]|uniref:Neprosin PEP catalytic domain-containing protein n=1 Tax=Papaver nudicaule TaxID=74823 RepID=A0AA41VSM3_PAPNU|nr:hypothetical protein [Papaver nudicaule]
MASFSGLKIGSFLPLTVGLILAFHVVILVEGRRDIAIGLSEEDELEIDRQLNILNKEPVKTMHTIWGDIYDCIEFHKQPAFDHPLLKNRVIPKKDEITASTRPHNAQMSQTQGCPKGTVPIRRTTKEDLIRAKYLSSSSNDAGVSYRAGIKIQIPDPNTRFYGAKGTTNLWNPKVNDEQWSGAEMDLRASNNTEVVNQIRFGWMVNPRLYGDHVTRTFMYWTDDGGATTGCYDYLCPGFVQVDPKYTPLFYYNQTSIVGGEQIELWSSIYLQQSGDWWLNLLIDDEQYQIGYWPKELFRLLNSGAEFIYWGGRATIDSKQIAPEMASGKQLDDSSNHNGYIAGLKYTDKDKIPWTPEQKIPLKVDCKGKGYDATWDSENAVLTYGGPGGCSIVADSTVGVLK